MRNKIYICTAAVLFGLLFLWCPLSFALDYAGIMKVEDMANYKDPEKMYYYDSEDKRVKVSEYIYTGETDENENSGSIPSGSIPSGSIPYMSLLYMNVFNAIEQGKAAINTVYTNYLPLYADILKFVNSGESYIQDEFVTMLYELEEKKSAPVSAAEKSDADILQDMNSGETEDTSEDSAPAEPETPPVKFISSKIADAGMFRVYRVRSADNSIGFLDISMSMSYDKAAQNMLDEQGHINRIAAANTDVNFFVYIGTRMQDTEYYSDIVPNEASTKQIFDDFVNGITGVAGIAWLDIDTLDERLERCYLTDHHWNALGAYQGYTEMVDMMSKVLDIGDPLPLKGLIEFPNVEYRGSGAARTQTPVYYDSFSVMDIDLPKQHPTQKVTSKLNDYLNGNYDAGKDNNIYTSHYENFYNTPTIITYPENSTGRKLLILGDSYSYWVSWLIGAHFDQTFIHYTLHEKNLDYNKFIADNGITDVLLLQYSSRTLSKATSATKYLDQIITK